MPNPFKFIGGKLDDAGEAVKDAIVTAALTEVHESLVRGELITLAALHPDKPVYKRMLDDLKSN